MTTTPKPLTPEGLAEIVAEHGKDDDGLCFRCPDGAWPCSLLDLAEALWLAWAEIERLRHEAEMAKQMLDAPKNATNEEVWRRNTAAWKILFSALRGEEPR